LSSDAESEALAAEFVDRFGAMPAEVENLLQVVHLKRACRQAGVEKLEAGPKGMVLQFRGNAFRNPAGLVQWLGTKKGTVKLRPDHKLAVVRDMNVAERRGIIKLGPCRKPSQSCLRTQKFFGSFFQKRTSFLKKRSKRLLCPGFFDAPLASAGTG
jgi:hypothetical protein